MKRAMIQMALAPVACLAVASSAWAQTYTTITLPSEALNADIRTWSAGGDYAYLYPSSSQTTGSGVPFVFAANAAGNTVLNDYTAFDIPVGVGGVSTVYTLINSSFGAGGANIGQLTFTGSHGDTYSVDLIESVNVRDHFDGYYVNNLTDTTVEANVFGAVGYYRAHLDMQRFDLPTAFLGQTLTSVTFKSNHLGASGQPFLAGMTVASVPEPESLALLLAGLGVTALLKQRRRLA
jgi:hypothetical protein